MVLINTCFDCTNFGYTSHDLGLDWWCDEYDQIDGIDFDLMPFDDWIVNAKDCPKAKLVIGAEFTNSTPAPDEIVLIKNVSYKGRKTLIFTTQWWRIDESLEAGRKM